MKRFDGIAKLFDLSDLIMRLAIVRSKAVNNLAIPTTDNLEQRLKGVDFDGQNTKSVERCVSHDHCGGTAHQAALMHNKYHL